VDFDIKPASDYHLDDLVKLLNCGFEDYFVPIQFNVPHFWRCLAAVISKPNTEQGVIWSLLVETHARGGSLG